MDEGALERSTSPIPSPCPAPRYHPTHRKLSRNLTMLHQCDLMTEAHITRSQPTGSSAARLTEVEDLRQLVIFLLLILTRPLSCRRLLRIPIVI